MAKVFLFDELGELIKFFASPEDCAKAIGAHAESVKSSVKRGCVVMARYYVGSEPRFRSELVPGEFSHNAALCLSSGKKANNGEKALGRRVSIDELCGLELLSSGLCFDEYLFGSTPIRPERAESIPEHLSKYWHE